MKQYKITTDHLNKDSADDCVLDPSDPYFEIKSIQYLAGLGHSARLHEYQVDQGSNISVTGNEKGELQKKLKIRPGTPEWFRLWFTKPYLTNTSPLDPKFR